MGRVLAVVGVCVFAQCVHLFAHGDTHYDRWVSGIKLLINDDGKACTAFRIGVDRWLTVNHCIATAHAISGYAAFVLKTDKETDLALLRLEAEEQPIGYVFQIADKAPDIGEATVTVGYSAGAKTPVTFYGPVMGGTFPQLLGSRELLLIQAMGAPGGSGSPVLVNGKVVSVMTGGANLLGPKPTTLGAVFSYGPTWAQLRKFLGMKA
jgi:S1-C subfamily serine protease